MLRRRLWLLPLLAATACSDGLVGPGVWPHFNVPPLPPCTLSRGGATTLSLAVGQYVSLDPTADSGCVIFPANASATDSAEYLLVAQSASGTEGVTSGFTLVGDTIIATLAAAPAAAPLPPPLSTGIRFHDFLRVMEGRRWYGAPPPAGAAPALAPPGPAGVPPDSGSTRQFSVCARLDCSVFVKVDATAKVVRGHVALYVDDAAPSPALTQADLDSIADTFNTRLYAIDTTAFGRESDIDNNQVVDVLMTTVVNKLVTDAECTSTGYVAGFFFGADIDPTYTNDSRFNHGEVFYSLVADTNGTLSCAHGPGYMKHLLPVTFVHEFQHMISFNQHVLLRGGGGEVLWLNEGLSHFAEELGGRSYGTSGSDFSAYLGGDVYNAYQYLDAPESHFLVAGGGIGTLAERGAMWLFIRYLTDQFRADTGFTATAAFTRTLLQTSLTGAANVSAAAGVSFDTLAARWALANFVSDDSVPGFTVPQELRYKSWRFRVTYSSLHAQSPGVFPKVYPLLPTAGAGPAVSLSGTLHAGSGSYHRALQAPSAPGFALLFGDGRGAMLRGSVVPRLDVIRIR
jgi:hypothetical protein